MFNFNEKELENINVLICNSTTDMGQFLFWTWELWEIGGGSDVEWKFLNRNIIIGEHNPLWLWFYFQKWYRRTK
jgi:hypothetical protein